MPRRLPVLLFVLLFALPVQAQVQRGLQELHVAGGGAVLANSVVYVYNGTYGFFLTDHLALGPVIRGGHTRYRLDDETDETETAVSLGGQLQLHLGRPGERTVPFVGASVEAGLGDTDPVLFGAAAGAKVFVAPGGALVPSAFVQVAPSGAAVLGLQVGLSVFIRSF